MNFIKDQLVYWNKFKPLSASIHHIPTLYSRGIKLQSQLADNCRDWISVKIVQNRFLLNSYLIIIQCYSVVNKAMLHKEIK